jgi:hypothetical protein
MLGISEPARPMTAHEVAQYRIATPEQHARFSIVDRHVT